MEAEMIKKKVNQKENNQITLVNDALGSVYMVLLCFTKQVGSVMVVQAMVEIAKLITTSKNSRLYKNYIGKSK